MISQSEEIAELVKVDIRATIRELLGQLQLTLGEKINLTVLLDKQPANVLLASGALEQIITRLTANAHDAMPQGGQLCVSTRIKTLSNHESLTSGRYVELVVGDASSGVDAAFEPFLTTESNQGDCGLGTVQSLVKRGHGCIKVNSETGSGTTFKILLPTCEQRASSLSAMGGTEKILLVDDSYLIRQLVCQVLTKKGYSVIGAKDGPGALDLINDTGLTPDLLLTDIMMPHMSGLELASKIRKSSPETKILFMSGHTEDADVAQGCRQRDASLLSKPFTPIKLLESIRASLDQHEFSKSSALIEES